MQVRTGVWNILRTLNDLLPRPSPVDPSMNALQTIRGLPSCWLAFGTWVPCVEIFPHLPASSVPERCFPGQPRSGKKDGKACVLRFSSNATHYAFVQYYLGGDSYRPAASANDTPVLSVGKYPCSNGDLIPSQYRTSEKKTFQHLKPACQNPFSERNYPALQACLSEGLQVRGTGIWFS